MGRRDVRARRRAGGRHDHHAQVHRPAAGGRGGGGDPGHGPGVAAARAARHGQDLAERAPGRRHLGQLDAPRPRDGRDAGGVVALRLELRPPAHRGPERAGARAQPGAAGHAGRRPRPGRGADPHPVRRAGRPHHHPVREDAAHPRAGHGGAGRAGLQRHRHGQRSRPRRQRAVQRAAPPVQHGAPPAARLRGRRGRHRGPPRRRHRQGVGAARPPERRRRDPPGRDRVP